MALIQSTAIPSGATDYELEQSLKLDSASVANLQFTPSSASNRKTWTVSFWCKVNDIESGSQFILSGGNGCTDRIGVKFDSDMHLVVSVCGVGDMAETNAVFRDASAWYHFVVAIDTTKSVSNERIKFYVNGSYADKTDHNSLTHNKDYQINSTDLHSIGALSNDVTSSSYTFGGYLAEMHFIDGQQLTASDFGETGDYGEWKPIEYSGTYGNNGFYLPFKQDYTVEGFSTVTYRGSGATQYIGGTGFKPDFTWIKSRDHSYGHHLTDSVRGAGKDLYSDTTDAEVSNANTLQAFDTDGFTLGSDNGVNTAISGRESYVAWNWDMGGSNASNTNGSITSTVRANPTYGQSIVSYTGNATAGATVGHGLSSAPEFIIIKDRDRSTNWPTYHTSVGATKATNLSESTASFTTTAFNNTAPSSTVFSLGASGVDTNQSGYNLIAYCFHSVTGYSSFGSYTGNGGSQTITTGFRPAFLLLKRSSNSSGWYILDNTRSPSNPAKKNLSPNSNSAESTASSGINFTDTGFQETGFINDNGETIIYAAFADKREYAYWLDQSGNNNDWTSNNLTESDVMVDSPTNNFATLNPLSKQSSSGLSEGNLKAVLTSGGNSARTPSTFAVSSGKWYWEVKQSSANRFGMGVFDTENYVMTDEDAGIDAYEWAWILDGGASSQGIKFNNAVSADYGVEASDGDVIMVALDVDNNAIWFGKNDSWFNTDGSASSATVKTQIEAGTTTNAAFTNLTSSLTPMFVRQTSTDTLIANFGQDSSFAGTKTAQGNSDSGGIGDFYYTPPSGFKALCTSNLPDVAVTPSEHFNTVLYSGTGATRSITGVGFQPDWVWFKERNNAVSHRVFDSVRGATKRMFPNNTDAESTQATALTSFDNDGFSLGSGGAVNGGSDTYVAWNWKANGSGSSNTNGSITSTVSANVDSGFSVSTWTGNATSGASVGHGLSKAPEMIINKCRSSAGNWAVYHASNTSAPETEYLELETTAATADIENIWNDQAPTNSVFYLGNNAAVNGNGETFVTYCFHSVDGYSAVGSYIGNGNADGTFVYTGFRVKWLLHKKTNGSANWIMTDAIRNTSNPVGKYLMPNESNAEADGTSFFDYTSNGFKLRTSGGGQNGSGDTHIFIAFAETPFKYSNAR